VKETILDISGMSCQHCVARVQKAIAVLPGILEMDVTVGKAAVSFDESMVSERDIKQAVETAGYGIL
jgi:copper ion binding protein